MGAPTVAKSVREGSLRSSSLPGSPRLAESCGQLFERHRAFEPTLGRGTEMTDADADVRSYFEPEEIAALASFEAGHY
jgi:hypothetical protein